MRLCHLLFLLVFCSHISVAGDDEPKKRNHSWYSAGGYNLDWYSRSDIHFKNTEGPHYDFTLHNLNAKDRPGLKRIFQRCYCLE
jgi:hypothetical protein